MEAQYLKFEDEYREKWKNDKPDLSFVGSGPLSDSLEPSSPK